MQRQKLLFQKLFKSKNLRKIIFLSCMWGGILIFLVCGAASHGELFLRSFFNDSNDTFMDFFNSLQYELHPYENKVIYPPLANLFYYIVHAFIPENIFSLGAVSIRDSQIGRILIILYMLITFFLFYLAIGKMDKKSNDNMRMILFLTILFSEPMLYTIERANLIIVALIFMMLFCAYYESKNNILKHFAFLSLAIAASIKIYPAVLGLLLLRDRRWKDSFICIIYGILVFFLPFIFFGGFKNVVLMLNNITNCGSSMLANGEGWKLSILSICNYFSVWFTGTIGSYATLSTFLKLICFIGGCIILLFVDYNEKWKLYMVPTLMMVMLPDFSYIYSAIFLVIPLLYYLNTDASFKKFDIVYIVLFLLVMLPLVEKNLDIFIPFQQDYYPLNLSTLVESLSCLIFMILIWGEGIFQLIKKIVKNLKVIKS